MTKKTSVKATPLTVATCLVIRLMPAMEKSRAAIAPRPMGISLRFKSRLKGTFHSRGLLSLKRRTRTASPLNANDQTTPNA